MSTFKIVTVINWVLISVYGAIVFWALLQANSPTDAAGRGQETAIKALAFILLIAVAGMNLGHYNWLKIIAMTMLILLLLVIFLVMF
jgi:hypothetical protein